MEIKSRLDLTEIFCDVDDFYQSFEQHCRDLPQLTAIAGEKRCRSRMRLSEVMTIVIAFHGSGYRTFKEFYSLQVQPICGTNALVNDAVVLFFADKKRRSYRY